MRTRIKKIIIEKVERKRSNEKDSFKRKEKHYERNYKIG